MMTGIMVALLIMKIQISCIWAGQLVMVMTDEYGKCYYGRRL
jgi:hypothetical protein